MSNLEKSRQAPSVILASCALTSFVSPTLCAAELFKANSIAIAGSNVRVTTSATASLGHDDNLTYADSNMVSSSYAVLKGRAEFKAGNRLKNLKLVTGLTKANYQDSSADNFLDYGVKLAGSWEASSRHKFTSNVSYDYGHEARGQGVSEGNGNRIDEPVELTTTRVGGGYELGALGARATLSVKLDFVDKEYQNFRSTTRQRDTSNLKTGLGLAWRVGPRTSLIVNGEYENIDYSHQDRLSGDRDNKLKRFLAGVRWQASAETGFYGQFGYQNKEFDNPERDDFSGNAWKLGGRWAYRPGSSLNLEGSKEARDPNTLGDYVDVESLQLSWNHSWLYRWTSGVSVRYANKDFVGVTREDDVWNFGLSSHYELRRNIKASLAYRYAEVDSTSNAIEYEKNTWQLSIVLAL